MNSKQNGDGSTGLVDLFLEIQFLSLLKIGIILFDELEKS